MWDVGGQEKLRPLWRSYTRCTDGIIFVVDSTKEDRLEEAKLELLKICKTHKQGQIPVLILANKQDLPVAIEVEKLAGPLGLKELGPNVPWHLQSTCAVTGEGLDDGMDIFLDMIVSNKRRKNQLDYAKKTPQRRKVRRSLSHYH
jgi:ADP-ribosylation factor-like protein 4